MRSTATCVLICLLAWASVSAQARDEGTPFGEVTEAKVKKLYEFAEAKGVDLEKELKRAYDGERQGLERAFALSVSFEALNSEARMYGNVLFSGLLNLVESRGEEYFAGAIDALPSNVQQRVRDFLWYPMLKVPSEQRAEVEAETRSDLPRIFPSSYRFNADDKLFK